MATRCSLVKVLAESIQGLANILASAEETVTQSFRDAWACHVYMLYSFMVFFEAEMKGNSKMSEQCLQMRAVGADACKLVAEAMATNRTVLWQRGVPEEAVLALPC